MQSNSQPFPSNILKRLPDLLFMALVALVLGALGGWLDKAGVAVVGTVVLLGTFNAYNQILKNNSGIESGLVAGALIGISVGLIGWLLTGTIDSPVDGLLFGLGRGALVGAIVGAITRANSDENDSQQTKVLIFGGSILFGVVLGGVIGIMAGWFIGLIGDSGTSSLIRAAIMGALFGAAIGSYFGERRWLALGAFLGASLALVSLLLGGSFAGVILGAIAGSFAPITLVSGIGAFGGLTSRGVKAMVVEALEAPTEMLEQGAVPFLAPALMIGAIVGAMATGPGSILALTLVFALLGLFFGILREVNGNIIHRVTVQSIVEMAILGAEAWPLKKLVQQLRGAQRQVLLGTAVGVVLAAFIGILGVITGQFLIALLNGVV